MCATECTEHGFSVLVFLEELVERVDGCVLSLVAPPSAAPGTSTVSAYAHKEHKHARALPQAERMSGATWQSRPLHGGRDPTPTKPKRHEHVRPVLSPSILFVHLHDARTANASAKPTKRHGKHAKIGQKERGA